MFGKSIKNARMELGLTQSDVSKETGLPQTTISWIELDKGIANIQQCVILADYYKISLDYLIGREFNGYDEMPILSDKERHLLSLYNRLDERKKLMVESYVEAMEEITKKENRLLG